MPRNITSKRKNKKYRQFNYEMSISWDMGAHT